MQHVQLRRGAGGAQVRTQVGADQQRARKRGGVEEVPESARQGQLLVHARQQVRRGRHQVRHLPLQQQGGHRHLHAAHHLKVDRRRVQPLQPQVRLRTSA